MNFKKPLNILSNLSSSNAITWNLSTSEKSVTEKESISWDMYAYSSASREKEYREKSLMCFIQTIQSIHHKNEFIMYSFILKGSMMKISIYECEKRCFSSKKKNEELSSWNIKHVKENNKDCISCFCANFVH